MEFLLLLPKPEVRGTVAAGHMNAMIWCAFETDKAMIDRVGYGSADRRLFMWYSISCYV